MKKTNDRREASSWATLLYLNLRVLQAFAWFVQAQRKLQVYKLSDVMLAIPCLIQIVNQIVWALCLELT